MTRPTPEIIEVPTRLVIAGTSFVPQAYEPLGTVGELTRKGFFDCLPFKRDR